MPNLPHIVHWTRLEQDERCEAPSSDELSAYEMSEHDRVEGLLGHESCMCQLFGNGVERTELSIGHIRGTGNCTGDVIVIHPKEGNVQTGIVPNRWHAMEFTNRTTTLTSSQACLRLECTLKRQMISTEDGILLLLSYLSHCSTEETSPEESLVYSDTISRN